MDYTKQMVTLLGSMRRERNGVVVDSMADCSCGLNYGVSLPTVRSIARAQAKDAGFALYLWKQDVRELRLAALHIAPCEAFTLADLDTWAEGMTDAELAEEAAFAFLSKLSDFDQVFSMWIRSEKPLLRYATLQAVVRCVAPRKEWIAPIVEALSIEASSYEEHLIAQGIVVALTALAQKGEAEHRAVEQALTHLSKGASQDWIQEEMSWRLSY